MPSLRTDPTENTAFNVGEACLPSRFLAIEVYSCGVDHLENTSTVLLTALVCWAVYIAVVWQLSHQIRYNMLYCMQIFVARNIFEGPDNSLQRCT
jgi:hypothetical protein